MTTNNQTKEKRSWISNLSIKAKKRISITFVISLLVATIFTDMLVTKYTSFWYPYSWTVLWWHFGIAASLAIHSFILIWRIERRDAAHKVSRNEKLALLIQNSCYGRVTDIIYVLVFLVFLDLLPNVIILCANGETSIWRMPIYLGGIIFLVLGKLTIYNKPKVDNNNRKVLITGFSKVNVTVPINQESNGPINVTTNCTPLFDPFKKYDNIEKVVILMTNNPVSCPPEEELKKVNKTKLDPIVGKALDLQRQLIGEKDPDIINKTVKQFMLDCIKITNSKYDSEDKQIDIIFSHHVDYNSFKECNNESVSIIKQVLSDSKLKNNQKIEDNNIIVNITPGTAIVSSVMTLNSIKGERTMVYVHQQSKTLQMDETPNAFLVQLGDIINERN